MRTETIIRELYQFNELDEKHAAHIVRCVNEREGLLAALKEVCELDTPTEDMGGDWGSSEWCEWVGQAIETAKAALAHAEREE